MSNIIKFLEKMGSDATLRHADSEVIVDELVEQGLSEQEQTAILEESSNLLLDVMQIPEVKCAVMIPAEDDPDSEEEQEEEPKPESKLVSNF